MRVKVVWNAIDHTGEKFGRWTVLKRVRPKKWGCARYLCRCDCGTEKEISGAHLRLGQSKSCGCYYKDMRRTINLGKIDENTKPTIHPSTHDIAWVAGFYEGEGCCTKSYVCMGKKHPEILKRIRSLFGGKIHERSKRYKDQREGLYVWAIYGTRARGFLMTIYKFLSSHRRLQILEKGGLR